MSGIVLLYVTCASADEAGRVGSAVVEQRLAACANILPAMQSIYWWQGRIERADEAVLILKTRTDLVDEAVAAIKGLHSYKVPCVLPIAVSAGGNPDYLAWLRAETRT